MKLISKIFETKETNSCGRGLFATTLIKKGRTILKFTGPIIPFQKLLRKPLEHHIDVLQITETEYIDLEEPSVLVNHSCTPNSGVTKDCFLMALQDIQPGEEIVYDYSTTMMDKEGVTLTCACGNQNCRHIIGDFPNLPSEIQHQYFELEIVQSFIKNRLLTEIK